MTRGICKARDEAHIIGRTLDSWAQYCDAIHVYDDGSVDGTAEIAREHPAVVEVLSSNLLDPDRLRSEWFNRHLVLISAQRFEPDWIVYFDADEWLYDFDLKILEDPRGLGMVGCRSHDLYITPDDVDSHYSERQWVGPEWEFQPYFFRNGPLVRYGYADQRTPFYDQKRPAALHGNVLHLGKGISVESWEKKCEYYGEEFGKYSEKWRNRRGRAVQEDRKSVYGFPLVRWEDVRAGKVETFSRKGHPVVK